MALMTQAWSAVCVLRSTSFLKRTISSGEKNSSACDASMSIGSVAFRPS
ncbi:MAG: hypothetical protein ACI303_01570 [Lepagella sp.]